jgi:small subunit ribosomal protein S6
LNHYEGLFLVDAVEAKRDWDTAVTHVKGLLTKHGAEILTSYKWDERKLAYNIGPHKRGAYYLVYFKADPQSIAALRRDCDLSEVVIRELILAWEQAVPAMPTEEELAKHRAELAAVNQMSPHMG